MRSRQTINPKTAGWRPWRRRRFRAPLADKLTSLAPDGVQVNTYHGFCRAMAELAGIEIDFSKADEQGFWRGIQDELLASTFSQLPKYDCLVVDEGQDFTTDWYEMLRFFVTDDATELWLEDPLQNLWSAEPAKLPGFVTYRETANFRTPTVIARFIKETLDVEFEQRNTLPGLGVAMYEYDKNVELQKILNGRIVELTKVGFKPEDIAIVSFRGVKSTALKDIVQVGKHNVRRFTGDYDSRSEQIYTDGDITFETIYRFKGQQAPAVILVDLDKRLKRDEHATSLLYCAMTRATVRLELVVKKKCPWIECFRENIHDD